MVESAALLVDDVLPAEPIRQWVLSFPFQLRFLLARQPELMGKVLEIVYRTLSTRLIKQAGFNKNTAQSRSGRRYAEPVAGPLHHLPHCNGAA